MGTRALMRAIAFYIVKSISDHIISIWAGEKKLSRQQRQSELYVCLYFKVHLTINSHREREREWEREGREAHKETAHMQCLAPCVLINYKTTRFTFISGTAATRTWAME